MFKPRESRSMMQKLLTTSNFFEFLLREKKTPPTDEWIRNLRANGNERNLMRSRRKARKKNEMEKK